MKADFEKRLFLPGKNEKILCALSGGADSMCLVHLLRARGYEVAAAHYEHGLRGEEGVRDADFVADWCEKNAIPCIVGHGDVAHYARETGKSIEEAARKLRYDFLFRCAEELDCSLIATAHNADDNTETVLLRLVRGAGTAGLRGIPRKRGNIIRPLLQVERTEIMDYLAENGIPHVEDSSNAGDEYARNRLRHHALPTLRELNPSLNARVAAAARLLARDEDCLSQMAEDFLKEHLDGESLPTEPLLALHPAVASRVLRRFCPGLPTEEQTERLLSFCAGSEYAVLELTGFRIRRERGRIYRSEEQEASLPIRFLTEGEWTEIPEAGLRILMTREIYAGEIHNPFTTYFLKCETIHGSIRCTGHSNAERYHPARRRCGKSIKALLSERGLTRRERAVCPVLRDEEGILALVGSGEDERCAARPGDAVWKIQIEKTQHTEEKNINGQGYSGDFDY